MNVLFGVFAMANTAKSLVIVESPAKAKTINKYLGGNFEVKASMGHVRDLPSKGLNVDIEHDFAPTYVITPGRKKTVNSLKASAKSCDALYLATDLDREGEAIAWHLAEVLGVPEEKVFRVVFNAITKNAIQQAFSYPGKLKLIATGFGEAAIAVNHAKVFIDPESDSFPGHSSTTVPRQRKAGRAAMDEAESP